MKLHRYLLLCLWSILASVVLNAQNGQFDVRFSIKKMDCAAKKLIIQVQVRAHDAAHAFNMGDANYRFEYDPRQINNPKIVSQEAFSNLPPANDLNYGPQNLNGSSEGLTKAIVSLNTFYSGTNNGAKRVDSDWITATCIAFDIKTLTGCFPLIWHDDKTFPITGMNEVELLLGGNYNLHVVNAGGIFGNIEPCTDVYCAANIAPEVVFSPISVAEDSVVNVCGIIEDQNTNDIHNASICGQTKNGIISGLNVDNSTKKLCFNYKPNKDFEGRDTLCLTVCDNATPVACTNIRIPIAVEARPDPPSVSPTPITIQTDSTYRDCFTVQDVDQSDGFRASICNTAHGSAQVETVGNQVCFTYKSNKNYVGSDTICILICDNYGLCTKALIPVTISQCIDKNTPILVCPTIVETNIFGEVTNNPNGFISKATIADNCAGALLNFDLPLAKGGCGTPSVSQLSGLKTGSVFPVGAHILNFQAKTNSGLTGQCEVKILVTAPTLISPNSDSLKVCAGQSFSLNGKRSDKATYRWIGPNSFGSNTQSILFVRALAANTGVYHYIMNTEKCLFEDSVYVKVLDKPIAVSDNFKTQKGAAVSDNVLKNDTISPNSSVTMKVKSGVKNGTLNFNNDGSFTFIPTPNFIGTETLVYEVCYVDCPTSCDLGKVGIDVLSGQRDADLATNIITPNGDGVNDVLIIDGFDETKPDNKSEMTIYNQWGNIVYQAAPYRNDWGGTFKDAPLPDGTYYYVFIKDPNTPPMKSFITILR